jgi:hypothetical protein
MEPVQAPDPAGVEQSAANARVIEIGWLIVGALDEIDRRAVDLAREGLGQSLREWFPEFDWRLPLLERQDGTQAGVRVPPVALFDMAVVERDLRGWDFTIVVTPRDLVSHYRPYALAALSRSLEVAVISTWRIDPQALDSTIGEETRVEAIARRVRVLGLHLFGRRNGLSHRTDAANLMFEVGVPGDLDGMSELTHEQRRQMRDSLGQVADLRLEEQGEFARATGWRFYLSSLWVNRREIARSTLEARPWQFPFRLSRLTTAALSALLVLLMTAEVWDLGMTEPVLLCVGLSVLALLTTTAYVLFRQQLMLRREGPRLSEQVVVKNVSSLSIVLAGMLTMYLLLFGLTLVLGLALYPDRLVATWAASVRGEIAVGHYLRLAALIASLGLLIGALGASFEEQTYFRHVIYVDEET